MALTAIPAGLFDKCTKVTNFSETFIECRALTAIPAGLFDNCTQVTRFENTFHGCSSLTAIPQGLFDKCTKVTTFANAFKRLAITEIPEGLFDSCTNVTSFGSGYNGAFNGCVNLKHVPVNLFDNCRKVKDFERIFESCGNITGESPYTMIGDKKVHLYERHLYPEHFTAPTTYGNAFARCTKLTDYAQIPAGWK